MPTFPPLNEQMDAIRRGALEVVPIVRVTNLNRTIDEMKQKMGFWAVGLDARTDKTLAETDLPERVALVLGAEGRGLRRLTAESCDHLAMLPMTGTVRRLARSP